MLENVRFGSATTFEKIGYYMLNSVSRPGSLIKGLKAHKIISSARLPTVMLSNAPAVSPKSLEILSVASVSVTDSGMIASRFQMKIINAGVLVLETRMAASEKIAEKMTLIPIISFVCSLNIEARLHDLLLP